MYRGVNLSASAKYLNEIKFSDTSTTLITHYETTYVDYDEAQSYALTDGAKPLNGDAAEFRAAFGDYFVAGKRRGARFTAVYRCEARSAKRLDDFKALQLRPHFPTQRLTHHLDVLLQYREVSVTHRP